jgi:SAM-dependent methyltransferase
VPVDLERYYTRRYFGDGGLRFIAPIESLVRWTRAARAAAITRRRRPGDVLDVGCGRGLMLARLRERGWHAAGVESSAEGSSHARVALALDVRVAPDLGACDFASESFDAISFYHVLEHLPDPAGALSEARRLLRPGGLLVVEVPNFDSLQMRLSRGRWFHLDAPRHLFHFGRRRLVKAIATAGFEVESQSTHSFELGYFGMLQSLLNLATRRMNVLYDLLKNGESRERRLDRDTTFSLLLAAPAALVAVLLEVVAAAAGLGGIVRVYAAKP